MLNKVLVCRCAMKGRCCIVDIFFVVKIYNLLSSLIYFLCRSVSIVYTTEDNVAVSLKKCFFFVHMEIYILHISAARAAGAAQHGKFKRPTETIVNLCGCHTRLQLALRTSHSLKKYFPQLCHFKTISQLMVEKSTVPTGYQTLVAFVVKRF